MSVKIGAPAPDFTAEAYHQGALREVGLADFRGNWVILFFYPADFTCV